MPDAPSAAPHQSTEPASPVLLDVRDLHVHFPIRTGVLARSRDVHRAVDGVSFQIARAQCLGLVGESGCGKTTVGRAILRLIETTSGTVRFDGQDVLAARGSALRALRRHMQIVFQDPGGSLNPRMRVGTIIGEPIEVHGLARGSGPIRSAVAEVLERCGMPAAAMDRYPHEFSGGQKQRIAIARALALRPRLLVCDEPTSALDVSVQAQILNLLADLQRDLGMSYLFISHDIAVVQHMCSRIAVMHAGRIVEEGPREQVIGSPAHAYTRQLLSSVPEPDPHRRRPPMAA